MQISSPWGPSTQQNKREGRLYWTSKNIAEGSDVDVWAAHRALSRGMQERSIFSRVGSQNKGAFL